MNIAVIFAGGIGSRLKIKNDNTPKQFLEVSGKPIIIHTIELFENHPQIDEVIIACVEDKIPYLRQLLEKFDITKVKTIVEGGATPQKSVFNALQALKIKADDDTIVLIHDGVRPLITSKVISDNIKSVEKNGSAITCVNCTETIVTICEKNKAKTIHNRQNLKVARAPQSFYFNDLLNAHLKANIENAEYIDSCSLMKYYGAELHFIDGPEENIKITTPSDFFVFEALFKMRRDLEANSLV